MEQIGKSAEAWLLWEPLARHPVEIIVAFRVNWTQFSSVMCARDWQQLSSAIPTGNIEWHWKSLNIPQHPTFTFNLSHVFMIGKSNFPNWETAFQSKFSHEMKKGLMKFFHFHYLHFARITHLRKSYLKKEKNLCHLNEKDEKEENQIMLSLHPRNLMFH